MFAVSFPTPSLLLTKEAIVAMLGGMNYIELPSNAKPYADEASSVYSTLF